MKTKLWIAAIAVGLSLSGCGGGGGAGNGVNGSSSGSGSSSSGSSSGDTTAGGSGGSGGSSSGSGTSSSGSGSDGDSGTASSGADGGVTTDASVMADPEIGYSVTLTMDTFTVAPGAEVYMCQDFANPFKGVQADIKTYELHMAQGSHHMFAFYTPNAVNSSVIKCPQGGLQFQPFTFVSQTPNFVQTYPEGIGATVPPTTGFTLNVHYINTGTMPITAHVAITMYVAKPGIITQHVGVLFLNQLTLAVPPTGQPSTSTKTFTLPQDVNLLTTNSHMHQRATTFVSSASSGETLFQTTQWAEPPPKPFSPALHLTAGTQITWSCTYVNDTGKPLTFGESAATNVMCISVSTFYPVQDLGNPVISAQL